MANKTHKKRQKRAAIDRIQASRRVDEHKADGKPLVAAIDPIFIAVAACFLLSGFAALLYQAAWLKKLGVVFGTSHIAVATVLAAYMAGLAFGAAVAAKVSYLIRRPIFVYGVLEAIIGVAALLVPGLLNAAQIIFVWWFGGQPAPVSDSGMGQSLYYLLATFLILAVPTGAMGATLPLLSKYAVTQDREIGPRIGALYGINTVGAVFGALTAGFLLLPYMGLYPTLVVGAVINILIFFIAAKLAKSAAAPAAEHSVPSVPVTDSSGANVGAFHWVMPLMLFSGVVSFTLEVLWTRLLSHIFGGTIYAFSIMLACFLAGIAFGGMLAGRIALERGKAASLFVIAQAGIALFSFASYLVISAWVPETKLLSVKAFYAFLIIVPSTLFIGATYPLAVRVASSAAQNVARISGAVYAWNTIGAIFGALLAGFILLPTFGFGITLKIAMTVSLVIALVTILLGSSRQFVYAGLVGGLVLAVLLVVHPKRPHELIYFGVPDSQEYGEEKYYGVGRSATILMREVNGLFHLSSNGLSESAIARRGMPPANLSQKWLAGLTTLARPDAESMLIIGFGGGVALEGVPPHVKEIDVVELEPRVIAANQMTKADRRHDPFAEDRVNLVINDARNAILLSDKRYDTIVSQPSHPWTGGASHLYTREFLGLAKSRLTEGGVFLQWINSQFVDESLLKTLTATLLDQFKYVELYQAERQVLLFLGSDVPIEIWNGGQNAKRALVENTQHYRRMGMRSLEDALMMLSLDVQGTKALASGAALNTDGHNRLAFFSLADGSGLTADDMQQIFKDIDPLTSPASELNRGLGDAINRPYMAEQLLFGNFIKRTYELARGAATEQERAVIDALGFEKSDDLPRAFNSYMQALKIDSSDAAAQFGLVRMFLGDIAQGRMPAEIATVAKHLSGPERIVLDNWYRGTRGEFDLVAENDAQLAQVPATSFAHPIAVKLRVDWRVVRAQQIRSRKLAGEAMALLDDLLASYWNLDLYILRSGCALLADNEAAYIESVWAVNGQIKERLKEVAKGRDKISSEEAQFLVTRLKPMLAGLSSGISSELQSRAAIVREELQQQVRQLNSI